MSNKGLIAMEKIDHHSNDNHHVFKELFEQCIIKKKDQFDIDYERTQMKAMEYASRHPKILSTTRVKMREWIDMIWYNMEDIHSIWFYDRAPRIKKVIAILVGLEKSNLMSFNGNRTPEIDDIPVSLVNVYDKIKQLEVEVFKNLKEDSIKKTREHKEVFAFYHSKK